MTSPGKGQRGSENVEAQRLSNGDVEVKLGEGVNVTFAPEEAAKIAEAAGWVNRDETFDLQSASWTFDGEECRVEFHDDGKMTATANHEFITKKVRCASVLHALMQHAYDRGAASVTPSDGDRLVAFLKANRGYSVWRGTASWMVNNDAGKLEAQADTLLEALDAAEALLKQGEAESEDELLLEIARETENIPDECSLVLGCAEGRGPFIYYDSEFREWRFYQSRRLVEKGTLRECYDAYKAWRDKQ